MRAEQFFCLYISGSRARFRKQNIFKDLYSYPIEIINESTDKGQFLVSHWMNWASRGDLPVYNTQFLSLRYVSIIYQKKPKPFIAPLVYCPL